MKPAATAVLFAVLLLAGCGEPRRVDIAACQLDAMQRSRTEDDLRIADLTVLCMESRGWVFRSDVDSCFSLSAQTANTGCYRNISVSERVQGWFDRLGL